MRNFTIDGHVKKEKRKKERKRKTKKRKQRRKKSALSPGSKDHLHK
jgi:hypothetical protein